MARLAEQPQAPRPGRSYCAAVENNDCLAPAGVRAGIGFARLPGVRRADLHTCGYCGEPVCHACSSDYGEAGWACDSHDPEDLLVWLEG